LLSRIADNPAERLGELALADEQGVLLPDLDAGQITPRTLADILAASASATPDTRALVDGAQITTYRELDDYSDRLARVLLDRGVRPGTIVACALPRSTAAVRALWAIAKTGAGFLPVDPKLPAERIEYLLTDSGARA